MVFNVVIKFIFKGVHRECRYDLLGQAIPQWNDPMEKEVFSSYMIDMTTGKFPVVASG